MSKSNASDEFERAESTEKPGGADNPIGEEGEGKEVDKVLLEEGSKAAEEEKADAEGKMNSKMITELQIQIRKVKEDLLAFK